MKAKPTLLEPIVNIEITAPADNMGDITGDMASRRGRSGQDMPPGGMVVIMRRCLWRSVRSTTASSRASPAAKAATRWN